VGDDTIGQAVMTNLLNVLGRESGSGWMQYTESTGRVVTVWSSHCCESEWAQRDGVGEW
jgi:hypothetical protein